MRQGTNAANRFEYLSQRGNLPISLSDVRDHGAAGRARAIASAIRTGLANEEGARAIERRIRDADRRASHDPAVTRSVQREDSLVRCHLQRGLLTRGIRR